MSKQHPVPDYVSNLAALDPFERDLRLRRWRSAAIRAWASSLLSSVGRLFKLVPSVVASRLRNTVGSP